MGATWAQRVVVQMIILASLGLTPMATDCWEECFNGENRDHSLKDEYKEIYHLVEGMRSVHMMTGGTKTGPTNGTVFLLDTTVASGTKAEKRADVMDLLRRLTQILAFTMPGTKGENPLFFTKFDGSRSWYCYEWSCLGRCDIFDKLETEYVTFSVNANPDLLDNSCRVAVNQMDIDNDNNDADSHISCHEFTFNELAVAMVNGPFQSINNRCTDEDETRSIVDDLDGKGGFDEFIEDSDKEFGNWCERKFAKRAVVGTLDADEDDMDAFATVSQGKFTGSTFVNEGEDMLAAADAIANCMHTACCPSTRRKRQISGDTCVEFADTFNTFNPS